MGTRGRPRGLVLWPRAEGTESRREVVVSKCLSLGLAVAVVAAMGYALFKFFGMLHSKQIGIGSLWFVPASMAVVIAVLLVRVVRPLLREIISKGTPR
jgi:hypothetical protein